MNKKCFIACRPEVVKSGNCDCINQMHNMSDDLLDLDDNQERYKKEESDIFKRAMEEAEKRFPFMELSMGCFEDTNEWPREVWEQCVEWFKKELEK